MIYWVSNPKKQNMKILLLTLFFITNFSAKALGIEQEPAKRVYFYDSNDQLCAVDFNGNRNQCYHIHSSFPKFQFSPHGKYLATLSDKNLVILDLNKNGITKLTSDGYSKYDFQWSPDSNFIAYIVQDSDTNGDGRIDHRDKASIVIINTISHKTTRLVLSGTNLSAAIYWSKTGKLIYFSDIIDSKKEVFMAVNIKDREISKIAEAKWRTTSLDKIADSKYFHINQNNLPDNDETKSSDYSTENGMTVYAQRGNIFVKNENNPPTVLLEFKDYDFKKNPGYYNPRWYDKTHVIAVGPEYKLPFLSYYLGKAIYIVDIERKEKRKLVSGGSPGWLKF